jgi:hypothetical protein
MDPQDFELACKAVTALERIADALEALENIDYGVSALERVAAVLENVERDGEIRVWAKK